MTNQISPHHHHHHIHHHHPQHHHNSQGHSQQSRRAVDLRIPAIEKYAYCLCLHVKPTTIFIAVFKLIRALLFASMLLNTEISLNDQVNDTAFGPYEERHKSTTAAINILGRVIMASVSAVGIYAVISGRAALLMPLYAMLLVDFFFALPAFYNRDLDSSLVDGFGNFKGYPDTGGLGQPGLGGGGGVIGSGGGVGPANSQYTRYSLIAVSTATMIVKIYFLCVIWKCYRYLRLIELVSPIRLSEIYPHIHPNATHPQYPIVRVLSSSDSTDSGGGVGGGNNMAPPPYDSIASTMKPPNYEEAMKSSGMMPTYPSTGTTQHTTNGGGLLSPTAIAPSAQSQQSGTVAQQQQQHAVVFTDPNSTTEHILPIPTQLISTISTNECCRIVPQDSSVQPLQLSADTNSSSTALASTTGSAPTRCNTVHTNADIGRLTSAGSISAPMHSDASTNNDSTRTSSLADHCEGNSRLNPVEPLSCPTGNSRH